MQSESTGSLDAPTLSSFAVRRATAKDLLEGQSCCLVARQPFSTPRASTARQDGWLLCPDAPLNAEGISAIRSRYAGSLKKFIIFIASAKSPLSLILPSANALIAFSLPAMICR